MKKMEEEQLKFIVELINKLESKIEKKIEELEKKINNLKNKKETDDEEFALIKKKVLEIDNTVNNILEKVKVFDPQFFEKFEKLLDNLSEIERKTLTSLEKIEKLEGELPTMFYHLKDLTNYEEKLNELIEKIKKWDKLFGIAEIEYYPERINLIKNWVEDQLKKGYSLDEVREELIKNGYSTFFIHKVLKDFEK
ncbi:MAG TPA: hypothetical protein EYH54_01720 [Nautiliaceae bacterium]|nr:hypothetical protein [Nautiliaceae bacterium]